MVVELGSGTGLVGCACACFDARVVFTDSDVKGATLQANVRCNLPDSMGEGCASQQNEPRQEDEKSASSNDEKGPSRGDRVGTKNVKPTAAIVPLVWGEDVGAVQAAVSRLKGESEELEQPDLVVASDVLYDKKIVEPLIQTLVALWPKEAVIAYELHQSTCVGLFRALVAQWFELTTVPDADLHSVYRLPGTAILHLRRMRESKCPSRQAQAVSEAVRRHQQQHHPAPPSQVQQLPTDRLNRLAQALSNH